jgi:hypothetical protein
MGGTSTFVEDALVSFDHEVVAVVARIVDTVEIRCSLEGKRQTAARVIKQRSVRRAQHSAIPVVFTLCLPMLLDMLVARQGSGFLAMLCFAALSTSGYAFMIMHLAQHLDVLLQWFAARPNLTLDAVSGSKPTQQLCTMITTATLVLSACVSVTWYVSYLHMRQAMTSDGSLHWLWALWEALCVLFAWVYVLMAPCLWAAVNAVLRNDIIDFGRAHINQETVQNGKAGVGCACLHKICDLCRVHGPRTTWYAARAAC